MLVGGVRMAQSITVEHSKPSYYLTIFIWDSKKKKAMHLNKIFQKCSECAAFSVRCVQLSYVCYMTPHSSKSHGICVIIWCANAFYASMTSSSGWMKVSISLPPSLSLFPILPFPFVCPFISVQKSSFALWTVNCKWMWKIWNVHKEKVCDKRNKIPCVWAGRAMCCIWELVTVSLALGSI